MQPDILDLAADLTPEQRQVQQTIRRWVDEAFLPHAGQWYLEGRFPREIVPELAQLGVFGPTLPGVGPGLDATSAGLIIQELERGDSGLRSFVSVQSSLCMYPIWAFGSDVQREHWLPALRDGRAIACFGLTESAAGSDPSAMTTRAERDGEGWVLNGAKAWITNATLADVAVIWAKARDADGSETVRGFLVPTDTPGFLATPVTNKLSMRLSETGEIALTDCRVPGSAMLPGAKGMRGPLSCLTQARFGIAFGMVGAAGACYEAGLGYARERVQFGRPIGGFQLVQERLVDALEAITHGQLLALRLARLKEEDRLTPVQVSLAKRANCRMALEVARSMRAILAANGITTDYPVFRHMANLETVYTYEGTHEVHTLVLGQAITGENAFS